MCLYEAEHTLPPLSGALPALQAAASSSSGKHYTQCKWELHVHVFIVIKGISYIFYNVCTLASIYRENLGLVVEDEPSKLSRLLQVGLHLPLLPPPPQEQLGAASTLSFSVRQS